MEARVGAGSPALLTVMEPSGPSVTVGVPSAGCFASPVAVVGRRSTTVIFVVLEPSSSSAGSRRTTRAPSRWPETAAFDVVTHLRTEQALPELVPRFVTRRVAPVETGEL